MPPRRFHIESAAISGNTAIITGTEARHMNKVLRLQKGEEIILFDGLGNVFQAVISSIDQEKIFATIHASEKTGAPAVCISVGVGLLKGKKMDLVIQKANELGIFRLVPYISRHCIPKLENETKLSRWQKIILESSKQCGRFQPLNIMPAVSFNELLQAGKTSDHRLIFWEKEKKESLYSVFADQPFGKSIFAIIGPEGGFAEEEINHAISCGFRTVKLGPLILRAETASLCVMSILQYLAGNMGWPKEYMGA